MSWGPRMSGVVSVAERRMTVIGGGVPKWTLCGCGRTARPRTARTWPGPHSRNRSTFHRGQIVALTQPCWARFAPGSQTHHSAAGRRVQFGRHHARPSPTCDQAQTSSGNPLCAFSISVSRCSTGRHGDRGQTLCGENRQSMYGRLRIYSSCLLCNRTECRRSSSA